MRRIDETIEPILNNPDSYEQVDSLGFKPFKDKLVGAVQKLRTPITVGLYGEWGSGKSTLVAGLCENLEGLDYKTLVIDAWKFRNDDHLILPILASISSLISSREEERKSAKKVIAATTAILTDHYLEKHTGVTIQKISKVLKSYEANYDYYRDYINKLNKLESDYKTLIADVLRVQNKRVLIIFIDNLDRCSPERAVDFLEDVASLFSIKGVPCIYMLVMDHVNVLNAVSSRYPGFDAQLYLEKIVHLGFSMTKPTSLQRHNFFVNRLHAAIQSLSGERSESNVDKISSFSKSAESLFDVAGIFNPRRIERIVNKLAALNVIGALDFDQDRDCLPHVIYLLLLKEMCPKVFADLIESGDISDLSRSIDWIQQPPHSPRRLKGQPAKDHPVHFDSEIFFDAYLNDWRFQKLTRLIGRRIKGGRSDELIRDALKRVIHIE